MQARIGICVAALVSVLAATANPLSARGESIAPAAPRATPKVVTAQIRSSFETPDRALSRDIGVSVALPDGHDLWLFGDTSIYTRSKTGAWQDTGFVDGSTALVGRYSHGQVPRGAEMPTPSPSRFVPVPKDVFLPDGSGRKCTKGIANAAFSARWPIGAALLASNPSEVLVTYSEVCVTVTKAGDNAVRAEGWGYMLYDWRARHIALGPIDVFKPQPNGAPLAPSHIFGWPVFVNGQLVLFSSSCTAQYLTCGGGRVFSVTTSTLSNPNSYHPIQLSTDGTFAWQPLSISVGQYGSELRMIETTSIGGDYKILAAPGPASEWHELHSGTLPDCAPHHAGYCHGVEGHPELSTATDMFISYKDPNSGPGGHMVISAIHP
jgi:hypothetical protein